MVGAAKFMHAELLRAEGERRSSELRGGGFDDVTDEEKDECQSRSESRDESPDAEHIEHILARYTRDAKASNTYLIHALIKLQESLAGYKARRDRTGGKQLPSLLILSSPVLLLLLISTPVSFSEKVSNNRTGEQAYDSYDHMILEDAKNVKMTSTEVRCVRQATQPGPIPEPGELETAADEVVATWERAMGLSNEGVVLSWNSMNRQLETLMDTSTEFSRFQLQKSGASKAVEEDAEETTEDRISSFSGVPRSLGGGGEDDSEPESSNPGTELNSLKWTTLNYMTMVRLRDTLKTFQRMLEIYKDFKARAGGGFARILFLPSSFFCTLARRIFFDLMVSILESTRAFFECRSQFGFSGCSDPTDVKLSANNLIKSVLTRHRHT